MLLCFGLLFKNQIGTLYNALIIDFVSPSLITATILQSNKSIWCRLDHPFSHQVSFDKFIMLFEQLLLKAYLLTPNGTSYISSVLGFPIFYKVFVCNIEVLVLLSSTMKQQNIRQFMKSRLRPRIRKPEIKTTPSNVALTRTNNPSETQSLTLKQRQFGQDITSHHNLSNPQTKTSLFLNQIVNRALEKKHKRKSKVSLLGSSQSSVQNKEFNLTSKQLKEETKQDIYNKIVISCQHVNIYLPDICKYLHFKDQQLPLLSNILVDQYQITEKMRMTLVDWIMRIHHKFRLRPQTLFKAIQVIDNYTKSGDIIKKKSYQLLGITSLYIACKYQQIYPPPNNSFIDVSARLYTFQNILEMEGLILKHSEFNIGYSTRRTHIQRLIILLNIGEKTANMARYLIQVTLMNIGFYQFSALTVSGSVIYFLSKLLKDSCLCVQELDMDMMGVKQCCSLVQDYVRTLSKGVQNSIIFEKHKEAIDNVCELMK